MGLGSSQVRMLSLTSRQHDITRQMQRLTNEKSAMAREARALSRNYNEALNAKAYKWSGDGGITYNELTYANLMKPNAMNKYKPYLITDTKGRVVIDLAYRKYAEKISPDGNPGGIWGGDTRIEILSKVTGIDKSKFENQDGLYQACADAEINLNAIEAKKPNPQNYNSKTGNDKLLKLVSDGKSGDQWTTLDSLKNKFLGMLEYLGSDSNKEAFRTAVNTAFESYKMYDGTTKAEEGHDIVKEGPNAHKQYKIDINALMNNVINLYKINGGDVKTSDNNDSTPKMIYWEPKDYARYQKDYDAWKKEYDEAKSKFDSASTAYDTNLSAEDLKNIEFYDSIFSAIAEMGWTCNEKVNETDYLNEMLQSNMYMITEISENEDSEKEYRTSSASSVTNIVEVSDSSVRDKLTAKYEDEKFRINEKEERIDLRLKNLSTEYNSNKTILENMNKVLQDNIDRTMNLFG